MSTTYLQIFIVFVLLHIWIANICVTANDNLNVKEFYDLKKLPSKNDEEIIRRSVWSRLFRDGVNSIEKQNGHSYPVTRISDLPSTNGRTRIFFDSKRTIPLELRKALYAHGIVG